MKTDNLVSSVSLTSEASLLKIFRQDKIWRIIVENPWQNTDNTRLEYMFSENPSDSSCIKVPVKKIVCFSSSHAAYISILGEQEKITGISGLRFICDSTIIRLAAIGKINEVGYENNLNFDFFVKEKPDVALIYGVGTEHAMYISRLEELGIKVLYIAEYLETSPLGRLEWIKLFGILLGNYDKADSIFNSKCNTYKSLLKEKTSRIKPPLVFSGSPIGDNWYIPGGNSFMANIIKDAGGNYIYSSDSRNESFPLSFESAYKELISADIWINCDLSSEIIYSASGDSRFKAIKSAKNKNIWTNAAKINKNGGNDFWESAVVNPEILLKDIRSALFPDLYKGYDQKYYRKL